MIETEKESSAHWVLTDEGKATVESGSHEALVYNAIPDGGTTQAEIMVHMNCLNFLIQIVLSYMRCVFQHFPIKFSAEILIKILSLKNTLTDSLKVLAIIFYSILQAKVPLAKIGFSKAMSLGWIAIDKSGGGPPKVVRKVQTIEDLVQKNLKDIDSISNQIKQDYKKRKLISEV